MRGYAKEIARAVLAGLTFLAVGLATGERANAQTSLAPTPKVVIYPGDLILDDMLEDVAADTDGPGGPFAISRQQLVGKMARRTLLPGRAIPLRGVDNPRVVRNGAEVRLVYIDGGLTIVASGVALQDGVAGEVIKLRNDDSGVTISGEVQPDGSVRVSGG